MRIFDYLNGMYTLHISTHLYMRRRLKRLTKNEREKINKGMNINV